LPGQAARVDLGDLVTLAPYCETGLVAAPRYIPPWAQHPERVLATLGFSTATQAMRLDTFDLQRLSHHGIPSRRTCWPHSAHPVDGD
jgi:hypothetical protein